MERIPRPSCGLQLKTTQILRFNRLAGTPHAAYCVRMTNAGQIKGAETRGLHNATGAASLSRKSFPENKKAAPATTPERLFLSILAHPSGLTNLMGNPALTILRQREFCSNAVFSSTSRLTILRKGTGGPDALPAIRGSKSNAFTYSPTDHRTPV